MNNRNSSDIKQRNAEEKMRRDRVQHSDEDVGSDVPYESKERHNEIAKDAGRKVGGRHDD
jgi:hypothetical protein